MSQLANQITPTFPSETWIEITTPDTPANLLRHDLVTLLSNKKVVFEKFISATNKAHDGLRISFKTQSNHYMGLLHQALGEVLSKWYDGEVLYEDGKTKALSSIPASDTTEGTLFIQNICFKKEEV